MTHKTVTLAAIVAMGVCSRLAAADRILAQKMVAEVKAAHPEITSLELAATRPGQEVCRTVAATEAKEIGQKCDDDEFTAMKTNQPFVEQEKGEFDATMPIHDSAGRVIGTIGMDFATGPGQTMETVTEQAKLIVGEFEKRIGSREQLFKPVK